MNHHYYYRSILDGYFNSFVALDINGIIYIHQLRICHFFCRASKTGHGLLVVNSG